MDENNFGRNHPHFDVSPNALKIALLPLLIGICHALLMISLRVFPETSLYLIYQKAISGHSLSLISAWPILLSVILLLNHREQIERFFALFILLNYLLMLLVIWSSESFILTKYFVTPVRLSIFLVAGVFCGGIFVFCIYKFINLINSNLDPLRYFKFPLLISLLLISLIQIIQLKTPILTTEIATTIESQRLKLWLGMSHLPIQLMTLIIVFVWIQIFDLPLKKWVTFAAWFVPFFVFLVFISELGYFTWISHLIFIPTIYSIPSVIIIFYSLLKKFRSNFKMENWQWQTLLSFGLFSLWGGITGVNLATDVLIRTMSVNSLLMPSHLHPLVAAGFTGSLIIYFSRNLPELKWQRWVFLIGVLLMSLGMRVAGQMQWPRRTMFPNEGSSSWPLFLIIAGASLAFFSLIYIIVKLMFKSERELRLILKK